ncbi:MAG: hypothetical protein M1834_002183 [Cirrosporium novae-zelandiae]|nr:MAG: hypothetical protein M1834_002183 [Cirrosporium novae-zelandiae]
MVRAATVNTAAPDITSINLTRLLNRLEGQLFSPEIANTKSFRSSYQRNRIQANIEYARTLLLRLEHGSSSIKIQSRKQSVQADLLQKRELIKRLNTRLAEAAQLADYKNEDDNDDGTEEDDESTSQDGVNLLDIITPSSTEASTNEPTTSEAEEEMLQSQLPSEGPNLRNRHGPTPSQQPNTASTSSALFTSKNNPSPGSTTTTELPRPFQSQPQPSEKETLLTHNATEQETLTTSLLALTTQLKNSSLAFQKSLQDEDPLLINAGEGLERNRTGMQRTNERMGMLKRMTEGRGLWGRMMLYTYVFGLMVLATMIVFVFPKLRL